MSGAYDLAPEFAELPTFTIPANRLLLRVGNLALRWQRRSFAWSDGIRAHTHSVKSPSGGSIPVVEIAPADLSGPAPTIVDYHGGAFYFTYLAGHLTAAERIAVEARCRVFLPDYRLSFAHAFPTGFDDCYATLAWVHANAEELGVDRQRVMLLGDSAGGGLAAGVAQKALDEGEPPVCAQVLIYPALDHEMKSESAKKFTDTPYWTSGSARNMWKLYLRDTDYACSAGNAPISPYAAPLHRESFAGLPPTRLEAAEFDPFHDEDLRYAEALDAAGVPVEVCDVKGAVHGYDLVEGSPTAEIVAKERIATIQRFFSNR